MYEEDQGLAGFLIANIDSVCKELGMYKAGDRTSPRAQKMLAQYERTEKTKRPSKKEKKKLFFERKSLAKEL